MKRMKLQNGSDIRGIALSTADLTADLSGETLQQAFMNQLRIEGITVIDCGLATTPALFMSTQFADFDCDAGVMLTASHLPYYFNGIKIFSKSGGAEKEDISFILAHPEAHPADQLGEY